ncbi:uncharacterized protein TDEL_0A06310 [Torulaspora delbrueckii]|uniref:Vacuolar membrane protein n=1 Tax=Torulaspora delbrueckii TaxID=4950 RepID=G8ZMW9_TORDE|nr:hypothetical protein TDEL_0A06310 [Torulaspora delbrueckii]CCE89963.1 hypothetical protein TDEL_0A06310 [Torulaspora delbrueckii]
MPLYNSDDTCQLLGPVSIVIQVLMGTAAVASLLIKRNHEHPRRKMIVWMYDVAKQISGALGIHFINLALSVVKRGGPRMFNGNDNDDDSECDWYFLNLLLDTTIGIPILWASLTIIESILGYFKITNIESGNYFSRIKDENENEITNERRPMFIAFLKQLCVFTGALALMKLCIFLILNYFEIGAYWFADLMLGWSDKWPNFQVFLVMFVCPIVLNCFQYFCVDNIIKLPTNGVNLGNVENFETQSLSTQEMAGIMTSDLQERENSRKQWDTNTQYGAIL